MSQTHERWSVISDSFAVPAPPEVVFHVLTDPDRVMRWLPDNLTAEVAGPDLVRVISGSATGNVRRSVVPEELRLKWSAVDYAPHEGEVRVEDSGGGGSTVEVTVRLDAGTAPEARVRQMLARGAEKLRSDVAENLTAG
jgi:uncharacterized protein YndB with AHSA1/START domain